MENCLQCVVSLAFPCPFTCFPSFYSTIYPSVIFLTIFFPSIFFLDIPLYSPLYPNLYSLYNPALDPSFYPPFYLPSIPFFSCLFYALSSSTYLSNLLNPRVYPSSLNSHFYTTICPHFYPTWIPPSIPSFYPPCTPSITLSVLSPSIRTSIPFYPNLYPHSSPPLSHPRSLLSPLIYLSFLPLVQSCSIYPCYVLSDSMFVFFFLAIKLIYVKLQNEKYLGLDYCFTIKQMTISVD
jgi:hypothetical protein